MLVADGLLVRGRGRSAEVRSFTAEDAVDLYRLRRPIEETAVSLVIAERRGLNGVQSSVDAFTGMAEGGSWDVVASHDIAFHRAVLVAAGSPRLLRTFDEAGAELRLLIAQLRPAYASVSELAAEHASLLAVLRSGNTVRAQSAWTQHFDDAERFFYPHPGARPVNLNDYDALSFDCYGTLIDWEAGIAAVLRRWADAHGLGMTDEELLLGYSVHEATAEAKYPTDLYPGSSRGRWPTWAPS